MPARKTDKTLKLTVRKPAKRMAAQGKAATALPETMITGKASPAKVDLTKAASRNTRARTTATTVARARMTPRRPTRRVRLESKNPSTRTIPLRFWLPSG